MVEPDSGPERGGPERGSERFNVGEISDHF